MGYWICSVSATMECLRSTGGQRMGHQRSVISLLLQNDLPPMRCPFRAKTKFLIPSSSYPVAGCSPRGTQPPSILTLARKQHFRVRHVNRFPKEKVRAVYSARLNPGHVSCCSFRNNPNQARHFAARPHLTLADDPRTTKRRHTRLVSRKQYGEPDLFFRDTPLVAAGCL